MRLEYTNGNVIDVESSAEAIRIIREDHPEAVFASADGFDVDEGDPTPQAIHGRMWLAWENADESENDEGQHAIAALRNE